MSLSFLIFGVYSIWLLLKQPTNDSTSSFNWNRDNIYIAIILLGLGGATLMVISLSMISLLIGQYSVSDYQCRTRTHSTLVCIIIMYIEQLRRVTNQKHTSEFFCASMVAIMEQGII